MASQRKVVVEWTFERVEMCFEGSHLYVKMSCELYECHRIVAPQCENIKNDKLIKRPTGDVFSSYLGIFPATLCPFSQSGPQILINKLSEAWADNEM